MNKQEEIAKTVENMINNARESYDSKSITTDILYYLHSKGVVIKGKHFGSNYSSYNPFITGVEQQAYLVEPLIIE